MNPSPVLIVTNSIENPVNLIYSTRKCAGLQQEKENFLRDFPHGIFEREQNGLFFFSGMCYDRQQIPDPAVITGLSPTAAALT